MPLDEIRLIWCSLTQLDVGYVYDEPGELATNHRFVCHLHLLPFVLCRSE